MSQSACEPGVYVLYDYRDGIPRYVGQTKHLVANRLSGHISQAKLAFKYNTDKPLYEWVRDLGRENLRIELVERAEEKSERLLAEEWWIMYFLDKGMPLYNIDGRGPRKDGQPRGAFFP